MKISIPWLLGLVLVAGSGPASFAEERRGGLALQFDDGWTAWLTETAPIIQKYGGTATGFVNDRYFLNGRITLEELRRLQDEYGWEIGTHTANHQNAPRYVQSNGIEAWLAGELDPSLARLRDAGLHVDALAFPFNASTPEIAQAALSRIGSYRRVDSLALADGVRADGSLPGTPIDTAQYAPVDLIKKWIDLAHRRDLVLFLYGHRVLPDSAFTAGRVVAVAGNVVTLDRPVELAAGEEYVLVPCVFSRQAAQSVIPVASAAGPEVTVAELPPDAVAVGSEVLVGPNYGTRQSDFEEILRYASERLHFYTIADIRAGRHRLAAAAAPPPETMNP